MGESLELRSKEWIRGDRQGPARRELRLREGGLREVAPAGGRLWASTEAGAIGHGGVAAVARAISRVRMGRDEARTGARPEDIVKVRRSLGKRPNEVVHPEVWRGDPESALRWTRKSMYVPAAEMFTRCEIRINNKTVAKLLKEHAFNLHAPKRLRHVD